VEGPAGALKAHENGMPADFCKKAGKGGLNLKAEEAGKAKTKLHGYYLDCCVKARC
jgi:hypothetical protein